jgi:hypothetical protein
VNQRVEERVLFKEVERLVPSDDLELSKLFDAMSSAAAMNPDPMSEESWGDEDMPDVIKRSLFFECFFFFFGKIFLRCKSIWGIFNMKISWKTEKTIDRRMNAIF